MPMSAADLPCLTIGHAGSGCDLLVQVVPNAGRTAVAGLHDGALRVRLAAPPIEGRANAELMQWLARALGLPRRAVTLVAGELSRRKRLHVDCAPDHLAAWLRTQLAVSRPGS
jgi:uncharacterized protein (TIGR00251 family)